MDNRELCKIIDQEIENGIGGDDSDLSYTRQTIYDRYLGEVYGNEKPGQSKITTREVFETVEWAMPSIIRVFESGDRVIEFDPTGPQDEQAAEQETDAVDHVYQKDNNGFVTTHNIIKSALLNPNSYVKVYRDDSEEVTTENYEGMNDQEVMLLLNDPQAEIEIVGHEITEEGLFDLEIKRTCKYGKNIVECVPEEEITVHHNHSKLSLEDCVFVCHECEKTYSDLVQMGYPKSLLDTVQDYDNYDSEDANRKTYSEEYDYADESHKALRRYKVQECYMLVDWDGDDVAERRRVVKIGDEIFENDEMDYMAIESAAAIIMPHKHTGYSLAQAVIDLQDLKTYFMRQTINNSARVNNPRTFINGDVNLADMLSNRTNGIVRVKGDPRAAASVEPTQPIIGQMLPLLELIDNQKEGRSGITRNSMGLDADVLAKSTEGAFMGALEKADQRIEFIVRVFAETVFKSIFLKLHHLILSHGDTKWMKLNGQWVLINPSEWKKREAMTVNVGLGLGNKNQKLMAARMIVDDHDKLVESGAMGTLVSPQNIYNGRRMLVEATGEKNVDKFYINPAMVPPKPQGTPPPDPNMIMIQSNKEIESQKRQVDMMKLQQQGQLEAAKLQFDRAKAAREATFKEVELAYQREIESLKAQITQSKNNSDAGNKDLQTRIDQLEMQLEDAQQSEKLSMDKYKADLDAETKLTIERMRQDEKTLPVIEQNQEAISNSITSIAQIISDMNEPKEIIRDETGSPVGIRNVKTGQVRNIVKDNEGLPVGVE